MHPDSGKKVFVWVIVVAVAAIGLGVLLGYVSKGPGAPQDVFRPGNPNALQTVEGGTREILQEKIATPGVNATSVPEGVAVPTNVSELSGAGGSAALRDFEIRAEGGKFSPNTIVVNDGDVITVHFTAVDADYNIFFPDFGVYAAANKGETVRRQFQATPFGQYEFSCKDCNNNAKGTLIVNEK